MYKLRDKFLPLQVFKIIGDPNSDNTVLATAW